MGTLIVPLTQGMVAIVDDEDADLILSKTWHCKRRPNGTCYAGTNIRLGSRNYRWTSMHRLIMDPPATKVVDHIDGNGLNNTRANLRICSQRQNMRNRRAYGKSCFLGVSWCGGRRKQWAAQCASKTIGWFETETEAAHAYDRVAAEKYGEFARLNFPKA